MTGMLKIRMAALSTAACLWMAGCVSTETTSNAGAGQPPGGSASGERAASDRGTSPVSSATNQNDETRRRARIRLELAANHYQQRNFPLALQEADQAVRIDPGFAAGYGMLGLVYMSIGDRAKADESFNRAVTMDPNDAELNNNYGWYLCQTGRQQESLAYFNKALEDRLYATPAKPLHNAGICAQQIGDEAAAENYFLRAFQVDPANAVAMYNLGELYLRKRNLERAKFYSERLLNTYQPTAETVWLALRVARAGGNQDYTSQLASQLRERFPGSREEVLLQRGAFGE
jgi:type IV pilus assembly protein PilF